MTTFLQLRLQLALVFGALALWAPPVQAQQMNYQGRLTDASGAALVDGQYPLTFNLYDAATDGTNTWGPFLADGGTGNGHVAKADLVNGRFNIILGPNDTAGRSLVSGFGGGTRYLEIQVGTSPPISPRQQVLAAPEALHALRAETAASADSAASAVHALTADTATSFSGAGTIPVGGIIMWSGSLTNIPAGWALCDGTAVNGNQTPDLRNRFVVCAGAQYQPGDNGGSAQVALTGSNVPFHSHTYKDGYYTEQVSPNDDWTRRVTPGGGLDFVDNQTVNGQRTGITGSGAVDHDNNTIFWRPMTTDAYGGGAPFDVRPPYYALAYIMRVQ